MHDCRKTRDELIDLAFNELSRERKLSLLVEIEDCAACAGQYSELTEAFSAVDEAADRAQPGEAYWLAYDEALLERLRRAHNEQRAERRGSLWKQFFAARLRVPVPVAALIVLLFVVTAALALRPRSAGVAAIPAPPEPLPVVASVVEVPVVREKIVTRVVYVERKGRVGRAAPERFPVAREDRPKLVAREEGEATTPLTNTGLAGFQPSDDVKLTIIKAREEKKR